MAFVDQLFHGDALQGCSIFLDESEHLVDGGVVESVAICSARRCLLLAESDESVSDDLFGGFKMARFQFVVNYPFLLGSEMDVHTFVR